MKAAARNEFFKGTGELATEALQTLPDDAPLPNVRTLERVANRVRENLRPKPPDGPQFPGKSRFFHKE